MTNRNCFLLSGVLIAAFWFGCASENILHIAFTGLKDQDITLSGKVEGNEALVLIYLSPECPLCKSYTPVIRELQTIYEPQKIQFLGVVSGPYYDVSSVREFLNDYSMDLEIVMDPEFKISRKYNARITPEVQLINPQGILAYSGAIDNWAISLGKKRLMADQHYLAEAIDSFLHNKPVEPNETKAVGCLIE